MKKYIIKVIYILSPLFITTILGILQGGWFDTEKYIEQGDIEVYTPSITHYVFFVVVSILLLSASILGLNYLCNKSNPLWLKFLSLSIFCINVCVIIIMCLLVF